MLLAGYTVVLVTGGGAGVLIGALLGVVVVVGVLLPGIGDVVCGGLTVVVGGRVGVGRGCGLGGG
ncbi:MAG TPA: hypothetical protein VE197_18115 [Mycobacterium sp.]|nr:hypothetical protein [Mycobacterium sp.]